MIELRHIHKYFNKNKNNEIHVINDTSIKFPQKGLVAITGPSGCGKTTLMNVIAGLDSFEKGEIDYEGVVVKKYKSAIIDQIRNEKIGFIFQNYHLLPNQTVYENIKTSLNIAGLYNKEQLDERIHYSLQQVGMFNYRKRNVLALSGGQQQRVGIARAISKNPDVIFADEPTGNLDSNNTFEIMSLIKNISKSKLIILVTHERQLVEHFADRIIELKDGVVVNDYQNLKGYQYQHKDDRMIYLKDLNKEDLETRFIDYYYEKENLKNFDFKVVETNDTIYIQTNTSKKLVVVNEETEIQLVDDHKKEFKVEEMKALDFDSFSKIERHKKKSLFRWRDTLWTGLKKLFVRRKFGKKLMVAAYFLISAVIAFQLGILGKTIRVEEYDYLSGPKISVLMETREDLTYQQLKQINEIDGVEVPYYGFEYFDFYTRTFYQSQINRQINLWPVKSSTIDEKKLIHGELPTNHLEIAITSFTAQLILNAQALIQMGYQDSSDLIGFSVRSPFENDQMERLELTVVGIIDSNERLAILADESYALYLLDDFDFSLVDLYDGSIELIDGRMPSAHNEILMADYMLYNIGDNINIYDMFYQVVGTYKVLNDSVLPTKNWLLTEEGFENVLLMQMTYLRSGIGRYVFYSNDIDQAMKDIRDLDFNFDYELFNMAERDRENYMSQMAFRISQAVTTILFTLAGIVLFIYFLMRTSMITRVKEIGIYRAIGATKKDVYKIFISEVLVVTTFLSVTAFLIAVYVLNEVEKGIGDYFSLFYLPYWLVILGLIGIYAVNLFFGLLPVYGLLRKTPSEILSKYDI